MVYAYGRKRKSSPYTGRTYKKVCRTRPSRVVRDVSAKATMKKSTLYGNWTFGTGSTSGFWRYLEFTAGSLPEWAEYAVIFDEYRVKKLKYTFRPKYDAHECMDIAGNLSAFGTPVMHLIVDPGSTKLPSGAYNSTTEIQFLDQGTARSYQANKPFSISFKPKVVGSLLNGGTAAMSMDAPWIRTSEEATVHTGLHAFIKQHNFYSGVNIASFDIYIECDIEFRGAR